MKKIILSIALLAFTFISIHAQTEEIPKVTKTFTMRVTFDNLDTKSAEYDISELAFKDEMTAQNYFNSIATNLVDFTVNFGGQKVIMHLHPELNTGPIWSPCDWNRYLATLSQGNATKYYNDVLLQI